MIRKGDSNGTIAVKYMKREVSNLAARISRTTSGLTYVRNYTPFGSDAPNGASGLLAYGTPATVNRRVSGTYSSDNNTTSGNRGGSISVFGYNIPGLAWITPSFYPTTKIMGSADTFFEYHEGNDAMVARVNPLANPLYWLSF